MRRFERKGLLCRNQQAILDLGKHQMRDGDWFSLADDVLDLALYFSNENL